MMQPIETKEMKEKREHRQKLFIGLFISFIMLFSSVGYMIGNNNSDSGETEDNESIAHYNGYTFTRVSGGWATNASIEGKAIQIVSANLPAELENISTIGKPFLSDFSGKNLYFIASSNNERMAVSKFYPYLGNLVNRMQFACSKESENESFCVEQKLPRKSCDDASKTTAIISIEGDENSTAASIGSQNGCLAIKGNSTGLQMAAEKSIFLILGIMK
jgi:hypothetical protein